MKRKKPEYIQDIRPVTNTYYRPTPNAPEPAIQQTEQPTEGTPKKRFRWLKRLLVLLFVMLFLLLIPLLIIVSMNINNFSSASEKLFGTSNVLSMFPPSQLSSDPDGTVHILIAGYSADDPGHSGAALTDSIMTLNINKKTGKGYMLSIPRDLYVEIPGNGSAKINEAYQDGVADGFSEPGYPSGGMGLLTKVVEEVTGQDIHYNFLVNYAAVRDTVDALEGITVNIQSPDPRGVYDPGFKPDEGGPLQLPNGANDIDGQTALNLTRGRGLSANSYGYPQADFNRTQYQQAVLTGIINELSWKTTLNPRQNEALFTAIADNVETSLKIEEVIPLFRLLNNTDINSLNTYTLRDLDGTNYLGSYTTPSGQSALIPTAGKYDYSAIIDAIDSVDESLNTNND